MVISFNVVFESPLIAIDSIVPLITHISRNGTSFSIWNPAAILDSPFFAFETDLENTRRDLVKWNEMKMLGFNVTFSKHWNSSHTIIDTTFLGIHLQHKGFVILTFITMFWYQLTSLPLFRSVGVSKVYCSPSSLWLTETNVNAKQNRTI